jgi:hypothetical protein
MRRRKSNSALEALVRRSAHMNHYAWASEDTVVQVHGQGPFAITYVNAADDPSK